jgi:hypothetical protein
VSADQSPTFIAPTEEGCDAEPLWQGFWERLRLPLDGCDLEEARRTIGAWDNPDDPQGDDGDCPHCVANVDRLRRLVFEARP